MIALRSFTGLIPKSDATKLPDNAAKVAINCDFTSGRLAGLQTMSDSGVPGGLGGFIYSNGGGTYKPYSLDYDADFARSPVLQDDHKRFYWTGKNAGVTEFKFARYADNTGSSPTTSYKVGVAEFSAATALAAVSVTKESLAPPVEMSELSDTSVRIHLVDAAGVTLTEVVPTGFGAVGTSVKGWHKQYWFTAPKAPNAYSEITASTVKYRKAQVTASISGTNAINALFDVWEVKSGDTYVTKYAKLVSGGSLYGYDAEGVSTSIAGQTRFLTNAQGQQAAVTVLDEYRISADGSAFPSDLESYSATAASDAVGDYAFLAKFSFTFQGVKYTADIGMGTQKSLFAGVQDAVEAWLTKDATDPTKFYINFAFGTPLPAESRAYIFTFLNRLGEESAPFGPVDLTLDPGKEQVQVKVLKSFIDPAIAATNGRYPLYGIRVYRATGASGSVNYHYACTAKLASGATTLPGETDISFTSDTAAYYFVDDKSPTTLGDACTTVDFITDVTELQKLQGLTTLYNGILGAFKDNEVWFCEPYMPWSWKRSCVHTIPHRIVALLPQEQGVYILTEGFPYYASGASPEEMVPTKLTGQFPCIHKNAATVVNGQAVYISPDGPVFLEGSMAKLDALSFNRESWRRDWVSYVQSGGSIRLSAYGHRLIAFFTPPAGSIKAYIIDMDTQSLTNYDETEIKAAFSVPPGAFGQWADNLAIFTGSGNWKLLAGNLSSGLTWTYETKDFILPKPANLGAYQMFGSGSVVLKVYADNVLKHTVTVALSDAGTIGRLPSGFLAAKWSFRFEATANAVLREAYIATSPSEFANA